MYCSQVLIKLAIVSATFVSNYSLNISLKRKIISWLLTFLKMNIRLETLHYDDVWCVWGIHWQMISFIWNSSNDIKCMINTKYGSQTLPLSAFKINISHNLVALNLSFYYSPSNSYHTLTSARGLHLRARNRADTSILTWHGGYPDPDGGSPRVRPFHCTSVRLTPAITPNVGDSSA